MVLYGLLGDGEVRADFPVMPALHQTADDALLPAGQRIDRARGVVGVHLKKLSRSLQKFTNVFWGQRGVPSLTRSWARS
jgi:hypothetical protein